MAFGTSSMDRPSRRPPPMPAQTGGGGPSRAISFPATQIHQQQFSHQQQTINDAQQRQPGSHTNTMRSTDLSTLFTTPGEVSYEAQHAVDKPFQIFKIFFHFQDLLQAIQAQQELVEQAVAAIKYCQKKFSFNGTLQEVRLEILNEKFAKI